MPRRRTPPMAPILLMGVVALLSFACVPPEPRPIVKAGSCLLDRDCPSAARCRNQICIRELQ